MREIKRRTIWFDIHSAKSGCKVLENGVVMLFEPNQSEREWEENVYRALECTATR